MKILKRVGLIVVFLYLIGFILPSKVTVERSAIIIAPPASIYSVINDLHQWEKWSPWHEMDRQMKIEYQNGGIGKGASYTWKSENQNVGTGKMEILESSPEIISTRLDFEGQGISYGTFVLTPDLQGTKLTWTLKSSGEGVPFYKKPISNYFKLLLDNMLGPQFEKGLDNISRVVTTMPPPMAEGKVISVDVKDAPEIYLIQIESKCAVRDIGPKLSELYGRIGKQMAECKVEQASAPMAMYPGFQPEDSVTKIIAMIPTNILCKMKSEGDMKSITLKKMRVVMAEYTGPYETNRMAYEAILKYMAENKMEPNGEPYEEYANDPLQQKDPSKYITNVYWPVK